MTINIEKDRRLAWARGYLGCEGEGEPTYQEVVTQWDLLAAMEAEAKHWAESRVPPTEITPDMLEVAERMAEELRKRGVECEASEVALASFISNMIETTITLDPEMKTKATSKLALGTPEGIILCLTLARCIPLIREAKTPEQMAAALNIGVTPIIASLTKSRARDLTKLTP